MANTALKVVSVNCPHCKTQKFAWVIAPTGSNETCHACYKQFTVSIGATKEQS